MKKTRESGIELLRILLMIGVIILHINNANMGGALAYVDSNSINYIVLLILENIFVCAVDIFVIITGYFLCKNNKRSFTKVVELLLEVILIKLAVYIFSTLISQENISVKGVISNCIPNNYFAILYIALYIISPYINIVLNKLNKKNYKKLLIILLTIFCLWNTIVNGIENITNNTYIGLSTVGANGSQAGYTIINFIILYIVGAYLRLFDVEISKRKAFLLIVIFSLLLAWSYIESKNRLINIVVWNYDNPFIIIQAAIIFLIFKNIRKEIKIVNELAKAAFTVFLVHTTFFRFLNIQEAVNYNFIVMAGYFLISSICIYLTGYLVYKIYCFITKPIIKYISKYIDKININLDEANIDKNENKNQIKTLQVETKSDININV